jgi:hypothetical protein
MKVNRIPGLVDVIEVNEIREITWANQQNAIDRQLTSGLPMLNGLLINNLVGILSYRGKRFPTMLPKHDLARAHDQNELWEQLNAKAVLFRGGPVELEHLAEWLKGAQEIQRVGMLLQEVVGRVFEPSYKATEESWAAAVTMDGAIRMKSPLKQFVWKLTGRVQAARNVLAAKVAGDRAAIHGTGIAIHNLVAALKSMRTLYSDIGMRKSLSPEQAVHKSLAAPAGVLRQATTAGSIFGCPFRKGTLFVLKLSEAFNRSGDEGVVFQRGSWNQCPAEQWVPALLTGVWVRAIMSS